MPRGIHKQDLPQRICAACGRPFTWRKKWERIWSEVRYCSDRCRRFRELRQPGRTVQPVMLNHGRDGSPHRETSRTP